MHYVYLLKSKKNSQKIYIGSTDNLKRRLEEHNSGKSQFTRRYMPWKLLYYEAYSERLLAETREQRLKYNGNAIRELKKRVGIFPNKNFRKSGAGFTLIELLVSIGIMSVILMLILASYTNVMQTKIKSMSQSEASQDGQNIINEMVKNIRKCKLSYALYGDSIPGNNVTTTLILEDLGETATSTLTYIAYRRCSPDGVNYVIQKCQGTSCDLSESCLSENNFKTLSMSNLDVDKLDFHISPTTDPYEPGASIFFHPRVTIVMKFHSTRQLKGGGSTELIIQRTAPQEWQQKR